MAIQVQYLGWSAFVVTTAKGTRMLFDPFINGSPEYQVPPSPVRMEDLDDIDLILVSHASTDHMGSALEIMHRTHARLLGCVDIRLHAQRAELPMDRFDLMVPGSDYQYQDVKVKSLQAAHISWSVYDGHPMTGPAMCYVASTDDGASVFHAGDTQITSDLRLYGELYHPDIAMLGVGGVSIGGRFIMEMTPFEAAVAADFLGVKLAIPMHYLDNEAESFVQHLAARCPRTKAHVLRPGETLLFEG